MFASGEHLQLLVQGGPLMFEKDVPLLEHRCITLNIKIFLPSASKFPVMLGKYGKYQSSYLCILCYPIALAALEHVVKLSVDNRQLGVFHLHMKRIEISKVLHTSLLIFVSYDIVILWKQHC